MNLKNASLMAVICFALGATTASGRTADFRQDIKTQVDGVVKTLMTNYRVPGMAVGVIVGRESYVFDYGVASSQSNQPVNAHTLFEIGSISKTFTATLAAYAQISGHLSLSDKTGTYLPSLHGYKFGDVTLLELGTHTPGGLPLQVPDNIRNNLQLMQYFRDWQPGYAPGTYRTYSNIGIGTLGLITAKSMGQDFTALIEQRLFRALGMHNSYINVPAAAMVDYAQGYTKESKPVRMASGILSAEAYGIRTTAADMLVFLQANLGLIKLNPEWQAAILNTHTGYFTAGVMTQDLIWEQYQYPVALKTLLEGNSPAMIFDATPVTRITPAQKPEGNVWINKTGSTNGFAAYVAFIPDKQLGIVILANKSLPISERVAAAYRILSALAEGAR